MFNDIEGMGNDEISYNNSDLRKALNDEILSTFPAEIRDCMIEVHETDLLRIPKKEEIFGITKDRRERIAFRGDRSGEWEWYWLMDKAPNTAARFAGVRSYGNANYGYASNSHGVRLVFCLSL